VALYLIWHNYCQEHKANSHPNHSFGMVLGAKIMLDALKLVHLEKVPVHVWKKMIFFLLSQTPFIDKSFMGFSVAKMAEKANINRQN